MPVIHLVFLVASKTDTSEQKVPLMFCLQMMSYIEVCNNADPLPNFVRIYIVPVKNVRLVNNWYAR